MLDSLLFQITFVGRPFPLADADEHLARLRAFGFTLVRLLVPWEAVEHEGTLVLASLIRFDSAVIVDHFVQIWLLFSGPGLYDEEYLRYLHTLVSKMEDHGLGCFIDPHQDVWSRWTGGDGAPAWTLEVVGISLNCSLTWNVNFLSLSHLMFNPVRNQCQ